MAESFGKANHGLLVFPEQRGPLLQGRDDPADGIRRRAAQRMNDPRHVEYLRGLVSRDQHEPIAQPQIHARVAGTHRHRQHRRSGNAFAGPKRFVGYQLRPDWSRVGVKRVQREAVVRRGKHVLGPVGAKMRPPRPLPAASQANRRWNLRGTNRSHEGDHAEHGGPPTRCKTTCPHAARIACQQNCGAASESSLSLHPALSAPRDIAPGTTADPENRPHRNGPRTTRHTPTSLAPATWIDSSRFNSIAICGCGTTVRTAAGFAAGRGGGCVRIRKYRAVSRSSSRSAGTRRRRASNK